MYIVEQFYISRCASFAWLTFTRCRNEKLIASRNWLHLDFFWNYFCFLEQKTFRLFSYKLISILSSEHCVNYSLPSALLLAKQLRKVDHMTIQFWCVYRSSNLVMVISITANQRTTRGSGRKTADEASRGKNNFFLAKWFGFGRK